MVESLRTIKETKSVMCLSPHEKLSTQRNKRSQTSLPSAIDGESDVKKKVRREDGNKVRECDVVSLHGAGAGSASDDCYVRAMDFDDCLNQDIDWVNHDEMDLTLSMDALAHDHDGTDFGFHPSFLRGSGLDFEDVAEMASTFVDPVYIRLESSNNAKDAEKLLMSFDTMNFTIPSPTSASSRKRTSLFAAEKDAETQEREEMASCASTAAASSKAAAVPCSTTASSFASKELCKERDQVSAASTCTSSIPVSSSVDPVLSVLSIGTSVPSSKTTGKKIGSYSPAARKLRLQRFHEKRKNRTWKKSIKYDCRKKLADDRPRIKGRFVRVLENSSDAKTDMTPSLPPSASVGYTFPISATSGVAIPPMATHIVKSHVTTSCISTLASAVKHASVTKPASVAAPVPSAAAAAALPFARMIASV
uniref:CCT domain-containing protein n=1 Tax=Peronospora matthiolae TaxID=2874970 RepID=A0AAV1T811_9STRA